MQNAEAEKQEIAHHDLHEVAEVLSDREIIELKQQRKGYKFNCVNCHKETYSRNEYAKYCCEYCRVEGIKHRQKSDFYMKNDEFERNGMIEWANPEFLS